MAQESLKSWRGWCRWLLSRGSKMLGDMLFLYVDRSEAGEKLAANVVDEPLIKDAGAGELLVLSIPRGGVVVGAAVARTLQFAHDVIVVKKIGYPGYEEMAIGAIAEDGLMVLNRSFPERSSINSEYIGQETERSKAKIDGYIRKFRQGRVLDVHGKIVILVDDGIATGETMKAAVLWLTSQSPAQRPKKTVIAVPVCSQSAAEELEKLVDAFICLAKPERFWAVGQFYWDFDPVSDEQVLAFLSQSTQPSPMAGP